MGGQIQDEKNETDTPNTEAEQNTTSVPQEEFTEADLLDFAMGIISNVSEGDLTKQTPDWQAAARRFLDAYAKSPSRDGRDVSAGIYGFAAWLTGRETPVTIGKGNDAAIVAELVDQFIQSQGYARPAEDFHTHLKPYPPSA